MTFNWKCAKRFFVDASIALIALLLFFLSALAQFPTTGVVNRTANLRAGPGMTYPVKAAAQRGEVVTIVGGNNDGTWYQLENDRWIAASLVDVVPAEQTMVRATPNAQTQTDAVAQRDANLRAGPGTNYRVLGVARAGQPLVITGSNANGTWLQTADGSWVAAFLVTRPSLSSSLPAPPPPAVTWRMTPTPAPTLTESENDFVLVEKRLLDPYENGGWLDGPSVHCGQGRQLWVHVLDENGNRLNGVAVQVQHGARETEITGAQGKGNGVAEFVLGGGQDVKVLRDVDASTVTSDIATGLSTNPANIPHDILRSAHYCQDEASCQHFAATNSCAGHFSWSVTFQRRRQ